MYKHFVFITVTLTAGELEPLVREETANCTQLGVQFDIPLPRLQVLEKQSKDEKSITDCFTEMCRHWLQKEDEDRKWSDVYKALELQGSQSLRAILEKKYMAGNYYESHCILHCTLLNAVELNDITNELREMIPEWYAFGCALGVPITDLDIIEDKGGSNRYMKAMLEEWKKNKGEEAT